MRIPNEEQKRAIESAGNVLLSAGAGSGKTYVLVEHVVLLAEKFIKQNNFFGEDDFSHKVKKYFSGIILITFTRKSTSEIRLRMKKRIGEKILEGKKENIWNKVLLALPLLNISTIHGFCSLLLKQGFFSGFGRSFEIMSDIEREQRIEKLFSEWFEVEKTKKSFEKEENYEVIVANKSSIVNGLVKIFNDPMLRNEWKEFQFTKAKSRGLSEFMEEYLSYANLNRTFSDKIVVNVDKKSKKWQWLLKKFYELSEEHKIGTVEGIESFWELLSSFSIAVPKKESEKIRERIKDIKKLKNFLKDHREDLVASEKYRDSMIQWVGLFGSAFRYIEEHYRRNPKMSYSDLEYYVFEGLKEQKNAEKVSSLYQYIVVDEFQDTSHIQFEIIKKVVKEDYKKLFCVGDRKQAIYGFRGGEVSVFEKCGEAVANNLELSCNFRSEKAIVDFNNKFFGSVLNCGDSFENICVEKNGKAFQYSGKHKDEGAVCRHEVIVSDEKLDIEEVEAKKIFDLINSMKESGEVSEVAILYKKLAPSKKLRKHLFLNGIPFVAQVKIPYGEDFVIGLCTILLEFCLLHKEKKKSLEKLMDYPKFMILAYFDSMGLDRPATLDLQLKRFLDCVHLYGFENAFYGFIYELGISNSNYGSSVRIIRDLHEMFGENLEKIYNVLKNHSKQKYSLDVPFGERKGNELKVVIMTVHSSKGLEFEHVILGGIHKDGQSGGGDNYVGKYPAATKWKASSRQKKPFCSPEFILEKYTFSRKEFAETKRLFYVACTRAVKGLHWIDISPYRQKPDDRRWVAALRRWCDLSSNEGIETRKDFWEGSEYREISFLESKGRGIVERKVKKTSMILPEISISGFVSIAQCPRKFYLQNICRFSKDSEYCSFKGKAADVGEDVVSSAARGTALHGRISHMIENGWKGFSENGDQREREILAWVKGSLAGFYAQKAKIFSEISVKFSFFGQIMSGTADLVILDRERDLLEIWDFKTGRRNESYWFQLVCYAYGFGIRYGWEAEQNINMAIIYLDKKDIVRKTMFLSQLREEITREWAKLEDLYRVNREHCPDCCYRNLCRLDNLVPEPAKY